MKQFTQAVSKFPFAGKMAIRPAFRSFAKAKKEHRHFHMGWLTTLLGAMIFGHARQAHMGVIAIRNLIASKIALKPFWHVVFASYTAANVAVTLAQAYLLCFCASIYFEGRSTALAGKQTDFTPSEVTLMFGVTFGGQMLFMAGDALVS